MYGYKTPCCYPRGIRNPAKNGSLMTKPTQFRILLHTQNRTYAFVAPAYANLCCFILVSLFYFYVCVKEF